MSDTHKKFELHLSRAEKAVKGVAINYRKAANIAILNFEEHGDLSLCQRVLDSMNHKSRSGVVKRSGFLTWLTMFSPAIMSADDKKKLVKDKTDNAVEFNTKAAIKTDFWTLSANNDEEFLFASEDIMKAVNTVLKRYTKDNAKAEDKAGEDAVVHLRGFVKKYAPELVD